MKSQKGIWFQVLITKMPVLDNNKKGQTPDVEKYLGKREPCSRSF